ncbi:NAD-dependent epimerase/dehydratase family protein [Urbifossiella limnaea]|uniref:UDP-glucose 4-epimerase n=1 Tax=Urbifossiella limnaea TaxID=2528023 RepID=A0A517XZH1_9BACT|nr:NAD(P)-dependent oxidoreductase [Urbifossiella limnaea]QDU22858.1 UDP-glucose 4-epimerase [Urbifossiella limnaea]
MRDVVLVTGGAGFVGTWVLRELLARGVSAVALDVAANPDRWRRVLGPRAADVPFVAASLLDHDALRRTCDEHRVTHFVHLAAVLTPACQADPCAGAAVNVLGGVTLFEEARRVNARGLSYASSLAVFGPQPDDPPPFLYGAFKKALEQVAEQYWRHFGVRSLGVRPHVVYGPERDGGLTAGPSLAARAAARGEPFAVGYTGTAGYDYVEDVARAFVRAALETPPGAAVVDLLSEPATTEELLALVRAEVPGAALSAAGPVLPVNRPPHPSPIEAVFADWQATPLAEGVRRTVAFYRARGVGPPD